MAAQKTVDYRTQVSVLVQRPNSCSIEYVDRDKVDQYIEEVLAADPTAKIQSVDGKRYDERRGAND